MPLGGDGFVAVFEHPERGTMRVACRRGAPVPKELYVTLAVQPSNWMRDIGWTLALVEDAR